MANPIDLSTATTLEQQAYLCGLEMQSLELAIDPADRPDNTQIAFSSEDANVAITITLETETTIENGKAVIAAKPYLA